MSDKEKKKSELRFWIGGILCGLALLAVGGAISIRADMAAARKQMENVIDYMKTQCLTYTWYNEASETKGLMRVIGNVQQISRNFTYDHSEPLSAAKLARYAEEQRLTGVLVLNSDGSTVCEYTEDDLNAEMLRQDLQKKAVLDTAQNPEKAYAAHIERADGSYLDLAACKRADAADALLTGPETRTSSPVRMTRGEDLFGLGCAGLIPCGEGAGYAGGIMSAAVDGIRAAFRIMQEFDSVRS